MQATSCDTAPTAAIGDAVEAAGGAEAGGGATAPKAVWGITLRHTQLFACLSPDPAENALASTAWWSRRGAACLPSAEGGP